MGAKSKLTLLLELKDKLFNSKLKTTQDKLNKATGKMRGKVNKLKVSTVRSFKAMREEVPLFGRAMDLLGNPYALVTAGVVAMTALFGKGFVEAKKFNHEFLQIKQLNLDKGADGLNRYKNGIRDAAFEVGTNLQDSTRAFYDLQSATNTYGDDAVSIFKKVGRYSIATGSGLNGSMNATTKTMKAFGLGVDEIDAYLTSNAKTVQVGITTFDELARVQTEYAGAAAGAGQNVDTANKIFAAFTSIAKDSATAATMTKSAFDGLTQPGTIRGLKEIDVSLYDSNGNMRDLGSVLEDVSAKFKKMTPKQIDEVINKIGGPEGLRNMFVKLKTGADDFHKTLGNFDASSYDLDKAFKNAQGDVTVMATLVRNRFNTAMSKLGEVILPVVWHGMNALNKIIIKVYNGYAKFTDWMKGGTASAEAFKFVMYALGGILLANLTYITLTQGAVYAVIVAKKLWTGVQWLLNAALTANPIGLVIMAIGALVGAIAYVVSKTEGWASTTQGMTKIFSAAWDQIKLNFINVAQEIMHRIDIIKIGFRGLKEFLTGLFDGIGKGLSLALSGNFSGAKNAIKTAIQSTAASEIAGLEKARQKVRIENGKRTMQNVKDMADGFKEIRLKDIKWKGKKDGGIIDGLVSKATGGDTGDGNGGNSLNNTAASQINSVTGSAASAKSIIVNIDAINKGGINTSNTTLASMNTEEIEKWFTETIMRTIRGIEMSNG